MDNKAKELVLAIWLANEGDYAETLRALVMKIPFKEAGQRCDKDAKRLIESHGSEIIFLEDDAYPEPCKHKIFPPFFVNAKGEPLDFETVMGMLGGK